MPAFVEVIIHEKSGVAVSIAVGSSNAATRSALGPSLTPEPHADSRSRVPSRVNAVVKTINKLSFKVPDWVPELGGKTLGFNLKTVTAPTIPYLATGAVIPPNAPFMAVLGDQKHGTNIEAPLDTIKQAVAEVIGSTRSGGGTYNVNAKVNQRTLFEVIIEEAKVVQRNTGINPFELA